MRLTGYEARAAAVREDLTYTDKKADWAYRKFKSNGGWFRARQGDAAYEARLAELAAEREQCLLFQDEAGLWTYSGLRPRFEEKFLDQGTRLYALPEPKIIPWANVPDKKMRYYQETAKQKLLEAATLGPAGVEMGTGLGKTFIIVNLLKDLGLPAVVMSPSTNIAEQIYDEMVFHFGKSRVGFVGDGKKQYDKLFTVAIGASLRNLKPGSLGWTALSQAKVFVADESHMCPAETLQSVCFGLMANAPYRFFFSGTQMRGDGLDLVLDGITGPIVYRMTVAEGVDQGFLAKPVFRMVWVDSDVRDRDGNIEYSPDANDMTRSHVFYNPALNKQAAEIANRSVSLMERPTVIMIDEYEQLPQLLPHLRYEARFAHGAITKENKELIPEQYWDSDPKKLVAEFNRGDFPILIGTSCIATGTDIQRVKMIVNLRGGKSEVEIRQVVGRGTRLFPGKEDCIYVDFGVRNVEVLEKHAKARRKIYREIYPTYQETSF